MFYFSKRIFCFLVYFKCNFVFVYLLLRVDVLFVFIYLIFVDEFLGIIDCVMVEWCIYKS